MRPAVRVPGPGRLSGAGIGAGLLVLFLLSGRWSISRFSETDLGLLGEPRLYVVFALTLVALAPGWRSTGGPVARRAHQRVLAGVLAFYGYMATTMLWAPPGAESSQKLLELGLVTIALLAAVRLSMAVGPTVLLELLWDWFFPALAAFAVLGVLGSVAGGGRLAVMGGGPNVFGRNMGVLCVSALGLVLRGNAGSVPLPAVVVGGALVVLSGSRGALVATAAATALLVYLSGRRVKRIIYVAVVGAVLVAVVMEFTDLGAEAVKMFQHRVLRLSIEDRYDSGRSAVYFSAWNLGLGAPMLGIGLAGFEVLGNHIYPHNLFLETFCEGGLVGVVLLLVVLGPVLVGMARRAAGPDPRDYAVFILVLVGAQFSGDLYDSRTVFVFGILLSIAIQSRRGGVGLGVPPGHQRSLRKVRERARVATFDPDSGHKLAMAERRRHTRF